MDLKKKLWSTDFSQNLLLFANRISKGKSKTLWCKMKSTTLPSSLEAARPRCQRWEFNKCIQSLGLTNLPWSGQNFLLAFNRILHRFLSAFFRPKLPKNNVDQIEILIQFDIYSLLCFFYFFILFTLPRSISLLQSSSVWPSVSHMLSDICIFSQIIKVFCFWVMVETTFSLCMCELVYLYWD